MTKITLIICFIFVLGVGLAISAADNNPSTYIDDGACPFECCTYREWIVENTTNLNIEPDIESKVIGTVGSGSKVEALTGMVIIDSPGKVEVVRDHGPYKKGDIIWVYTYIGEGFFKVWFNDEMYQEDVHFIKHGENGGFARCVENGTCWGRVISKPKATWWIKIKYKEGLEGWSNQPQNFGNKDSCS